MIGRSPGVADTLADVVALARSFGGDPAYVRAGGGNVSAKIGGVLYIKPSGVPMAELTVDTLIPLDLRPLQALLDRRPSEAALAPDPVMAVAAEARLADVGGLRPSVELLFHALIPDPFVLHTHPILANALTCSIDGESVAARLFGDDALWIPYTDPGLPLARCIADRRRATTLLKGRVPAVTLMQNHGMIVAASSRADIEFYSQWISKAVETELRLARVASPPAWGEADEWAGDVRVIVEADLRAWLADSTFTRNVAFDGSALAAGFTATPVGRAAVTAGPLTPDQIVYSGSRALLLDVTADEPIDRLTGRVLASLRRHVQDTGEEPTIIVVPTVGAFACAAAGRAELALQVYLDALRVTEGAILLGGVRALSERERVFIETWEAEAYRKAAAAAPPGTTSQRDVRMPRKPPAAATDPATP